MSAAFAIHKIKPLDLPELVLGQDRIEELEATEQPLGILPDCRFRLSEPISLKAASLYLYSDWGNGSENLRW